MPISAVINPDDKSGVPAWLPWLAASGALAGLLAALRVCAHGFDFTDESFYLIWIARPFEYPFSITQFGFIYHPIYQWLGGDIAALRRTNALLTFGLDAVFSALIIRRQLAPAELSKLSLLLLSVTLASGATASLVSRGMWIATPSYNSLCLQAILLAAIGLILADLRATPASAGGWLLLGVGGALTFMAKPSSAAALAVCSLVTLAISGRWRTPLLALAVASAVGGVATCALAIDGSLTAFATRLDSGLQLARDLNDHYSIAHALRLGTPRTHTDQQTTFLAVTVVTVCGALLLGARHPLLAGCGRLLGLLTGAAVFAMLYGWPPLLPSLGQLGGLLLFAAPLAALILSLMQRTSAGLRRVSRQTIALFVGFLALPYCYAFGTINDYWVYIAQAAPFGLAAGVSFVVTLPDRRRKIAALCALALVTLVLSTQLELDGMRHPYRQAEALAAQTQAIAIGPHAAVLQMSREFAQYITEARDVAVTTQFKANNPMIDLSGQSPGLLFALSARSIGQAWSVGGNAGSAALATRMLAQVSCDDLALAWILIEPHSRRALPTTVITSFGANLAEDFAVVGSFDAPSVPRGRPRRARQQILKPIRTVQAATAACLARRTAFR